MKAWIAQLLVGALLLVGCGDDDGGDAADDATATSRQGAAAATIETAASTASGSTRSTTTAASTTPGSTSAAPDGNVGDFERPVIGVARRWDDLDFCSVVPTDDRSLNDADFGYAAGPAEPMSGAPPSEPACLLQGVNVGEISFSITPRDQLPARATSRADTRGTWSLLDGNTSYIYCDDDEAIDDPACALFVAIDDGHWLTVFVFLPTNDLDDLAEITRAVAGVALDNLPEG